jgi:predicted nucleotidyltransferase
MQTNPTVYVDINQLLELLLAAMQAVLGQKLIGVYLYGSLVTGDFDHGSSDIDVLAVTSSALDAKEFGALQHMHTDFADQNRYWEGRIEVQYLSIAALHTFKSQASTIAAISPGEPFHFKEAGKDWTINWYIVQEKGVTLFGPSPKTFIDPISQAEFIHAVQEHAKQWEEWIHHLPKRRPSQAYTILTMCRALYTLKYGEHVSKKQAAVWAEKEFPEWASLIENALLWREAWRDEDVDHETTFPDTLRFVHFAISQCENS